MKEISGQLLFEAPGLRLPNEATGEIVDKIRVAARDIHEARHLVYSEARRYGIVLTDSQLDLKQVEFRGPDVDKRKRN